MKFNFKLLLAGIAVPAGVTALTFSSDKPLETPQNDQPLERPYIIEEISAEGVSTAGYSGLSRSVDSFNIANELGAHPFPEDKYSVFPAIEMEIGGKITLYRAPEITVIDGKKEQIYRSWAKTVGEMLTEKGIALGDDDKINFASDVAIENEMMIKIIRVAITTMREKEEINYRTIKKEDNTLDQGKTRVEQAGEKGTKVYIYEVRREDGVEVSRKLTETQIEKEPVNEILIVGTKPVITGWCKYNDWVLDASLKNGLDPNRLCDLMRKESFGHADSVNPNGYYGLFQYDLGFWSSMSAKAGFAGASWSDARAQIYTTAWAVTHGYGGRWPGTFK